MGRIGPLELMIIVVVPILYTVLVFMIGRKVGYGRALRDVAEGEFSTLTAKRED